MKKLLLATASVAVMLAAVPAVAAPMAQLDQYGCRWDNGQRYHCYRGMFAGRTFTSQEEMFGHARMVPVYIDDSGAPRSMPPFAARGNSERPSTDAGEPEEMITVY